MIETIEKEIDEIQTVYSGKLRENINFTVTTKRYINKYEGRT